MHSKIKPFILFPLLSLAVGGAAALLTAGNMDLYDTIVKPPLSPPSVLFPIAWSIIYILTGIGAALVYNEANMRPLDVKAALTAYAVNLGVNFLWSLLFFNLRAFLLSFLWLLLLWGVTFWMLGRFYRVKKLAGLLQIPYLLWVSFAGYLNLAIYLLNR